MGQLQDNNKCPWLLMDVGNYTIYLACVTWFLVYCNTLQTLINIVVVFCFLFVCFTTVVWWLTHVSVKDPQFETRTPVVLVPSLDKWKCCIWCKISAKSVNFMQYYHHIFKITEAILFIRYLWTFFLHLMLSHKA